MRRQIALLCIALATVGGAATNGAHAMPPRGEPDTPIYCDYGHLSGSSTWLSSGIGPSVAGNHYVITVDDDESARNFTLRVSKFVMRLPVT